MMRATDSDNKTKNNKEPESATSSLCSLLYLTKTCYEIIMHPFKHRSRYKPKFRLFPNL